MDNFPEASKIPHKLSPFIDDFVTDRTEFQSAGISNRLVSLFASDTVEKEAQMRSDFLLPQYYLRSAMIGESELKLKPQDVKRFSLETLMYSFYFLPNDVLQAAAAQELAARGWKYHLELRQWFRGDTKQYMIFDLPSWSQKVWHSSGSSLDTSRFLSEYSFKAPPLGNYLRTSAK